MHIEWWMYVTSGVSGWLSHRLNSVFVQNIARELHNGILKAGTIVPAFAILA